MEKFLFSLLFAFVGVTFVVGVFHFLDRLENLILKLDKNYQRVAVYISWIVLLTVVIYLVLLFK